jgi:hypothetical protein
VKKLLTAMLLICLVSSVAFAKNPVTCTMPKGTFFVVVNAFYGPVGVIAAEDKRITVLEVKKEGENPIVRFSLSYDKPSIVCSEHGMDTYEMYEPFLLSDNSVVYKESLISCSNEL